MEWIDQLWKRTKIKKYQTRPPNITIESLKKKKEPNKEFLDI